MINMKNLTARELIDVICPEHSRTSCNDNNLDNGLYSGDSFTRCARCTLLEILKEGFMPEDHILICDFKITRNKINKNKFSLRNDDL